MEMDLETVTRTWEIAKYYVIPVSLTAGFLGLQYLGILGIHNLNRVRTQRDIQNRKPPFYDDQLCLPLTGDAKFNKGYYELLLLEHTGSK